MEGPPQPAPAPARVRTFPCEACGAEVVWDPGAATLTCPYCGGKRQVPQAAGDVRERPIEEALKAPRDLGWGTERKAVRCARCGAVTTLEPGVAASACAFCGAPSAVEAPPSSAMVRPQGLLPFRIGRNQAAGAFRSWLSRLWFRPGDLSEKSSLASLGGVYVPFWAFDAATHSHWTAEAGTRYQVPVEAFENGRPVTRMETRIRWEPAEGMLEKFFDDLPVPGSRGLPPDLATSLEPFPTHELVPYEPSYLSGFLAEEIAVDLPEALLRARARMEAEIRAACGAAVPGDTYRNLLVRTQWTGVKVKSALLPVWIAAYRYRDKPFRFLVNGVTGKVAGKAPLSVFKVALAVLVALVILLILATLSR